MVDFSHTILLSFLIQSLCRALQMQMQVMRIEGRNCIERFFVVISWRRSTQEDRTNCFSQDLHVAMYCHQLSCRWSTCWKKRYAAVVKRRIWFCVLCWNVYVYFSIFFRFAALRRYKKKLGKADLSVRVGKADLSRKEASRGPKSTCDTI